MPHSTPKWTHVLRLSSVLVLATLSRDVLAAKRVPRDDATLAPKALHKVFDDLRQKSDDANAAQKDTKRRGPLLQTDTLTRDQTEALLDEKIDEEIALARRLLEMESGCESTAAVRFRLADMFWEKSKRAFFRTNDTQLAAAERAKATREMRKFQDATISNYRRLIFTTWARRCTSSTNMKKLRQLLGVSFTSFRAANGLPVRGLWWVSFSLT
jgi:hypothetical protein